jgi:hypothetical protein
MAPSETDLEHGAAPSLPHRNFQTWETELVPAGRLVLAPSIHASDYATRRSERGLELREVSHSAPVFDIDLFGTGGMGLGTSEEPMGLLLVPRLPQDSHRSPQKLEIEFQALDTELGVLGRLAFPTTGLEDNADLTPEPIQAPESLAPAEQVPAETSREPELVTKPLPPTLHGLAAGRAKPVQVVSSADLKGVTPQIPRSSALPLRPLMVFGPRAGVKTGAKDPSAQTEAPATDPKKQPARTDLRAGDGKVRKPEVRILAPTAAPVAKEPSPKPVTGTKSDRPKSTPMPSEPESSMIDLGLPSLAKPPENFWNRLSTARKALVAGTLILIVASVVALVAIGTPGVAHVVDAGPALAAAESDWIRDWVTGLPNRLSILRPSLPLSDYRVAFQVQGDGTAAGWVFRARDARNFYANKLEVVKTGPNFTAMLVRFAVIDGIEQPRTRIPLTMPARADALYKIRLEAVGNHFTTWVQDQKADDWTDDRIKTGGVGMYSEREETGSLRGGLSVVPVETKK